MSKKELYAEIREHKNCILCGAKGTVEEKVDYYNKMLINGKEVEVGPYTGLCCSVCNDGFLTDESEELFDKQVKEAENDPHNHV